jgi:hypothetical protein
MFLYNAVSFNFESSAGHSTSVVESKSRGIVRRATFVTYRKVGVGFVWLNCRHSIASVQSNSPQGDQKWGRYKCVIELKVWVLSERTLAVARRTAPSESYLCVQKIYNAVKQEHSDLPRVSNLMISFTLHGLVGWWRVHEARQNYVRTVEQEPIKYIHPCSLKPKISRLIYWSRSEVSGGFWGENLIFQKYLFYSIAFLYIFMDFFPALWFKIHFWYLFFTFN